MPICVTCHKSKHSASFYKRSNSSTLRKECKTCSNERTVRNSQIRRPIGHIGQQRRENKNLRKRGKKRCGGCRQIKPLTEYWKARGQRQAYCKSCQLRKRKEHRYSSGQSVVIALLRGARLRAVEKNLAFNLVEADITIPKKCPVLGIKLVIGPGRRDNSPSLDRIDNKKGYTRKNTRLVSWRANRLKSDATAAELALILKSLKKHPNVK